MKNGVGPDSGCCRPIMMFQELLFKTLDSTGKIKMTKEFPFGQASPTSGWMSMC